jgi:hypothetical protein
MWNATVEAMAAFLTLDALIDRVGESLSRPARAAVPLASVAA